ncbi:MAG TPA: DUF192 domain-containing protein [Solirubrobacterales bacterium]|nr:DUF192 domain-containing protein [Solirubrobacterales bacterium]
MPESRIPRRLRSLPRWTFAGVEYPVATTLIARVLGLALLSRERAGPGLLIPRCRSVHTFGMRFALDVVFLDATGVPISYRPQVPPRRVLRQPGAAAVLEMPS